MHKSVLLEESIENLNLNENSIAVDCTLGYAGHSSQILKRIKKGHLFAFDQDREAIAFSEKKLESVGNNFTIIKSNFKDIKNKLLENDVNKVDAILFDLGVSSPQLDEDYRGFSFHKEAPLDMRMNTEQDFSAYDVVNTYTKEELIRIFRVYGEEKYASSIAYRIVKERENKPIETTLELAELIKMSVPEKYKREKHPARKVFQAIRIEVNDELHVFETALKDALELLNVNGRICVITFHSLEDRMCKQMFQSMTSIPKELQKLPVIPEEFEPKFKLVNHIVPSTQELEENARARSAHLRVIERIKD
ncbi:MAG: 16S rRNA (cytosine(1402)-N(4))-methyltransferase RsmH [Bacilli bacterium]|nr:16S rRNA (cytosine(1402)-N(4))-methyltransferase RsmH [Bacilli bacterium]